MYFKPVSQQAEVAASYAIRNDSFTRYPGNDSADLVAAAAATTLGRSAVSGLKDAEGFGILSNGSEQLEKAFTDKDSPPSKILNKAVARYIDAAKEGMEPETGVKMVILDVMQMASAGQVVDAVENPDRMKYLNPQQRALADLSMNDESFRRDIGNIAEGEYHRLSVGMLSSMKEVLTMNPKGPIGDAIDKAARSIEEVSDFREARVPGMQSGNFKPISNESILAVEGFLKEGRSTGNRFVDGALGLLEKSGFTKDMAEDSTKLFAMGRLVEENVGSHVKSSAQIAAMAITDSKIMDQARSSSDQSDRATAIGNGDYSNSVTGTQTYRMGVGSQIVSASLTPNIHTMNLKVMDLTLGVTADALKREQNMKAAMNRQMQMSASMAM